MALKLALTTPSGIDLPAAYHRIVRIDEVFESGIAVVHVRTYATEEARRAGKGAVDGDLTFTFQITGDTDRAAAYALLAALPEFAWSEAV